MLFFRPGRQLGRSQPGVAVPAGGGLAAGFAAHAAGAAGARLPAGLARQLLAEPTRAL